MKEALTSAVRASCQVSHFFHKFPYPNKEFAALSERRSYEKQKCARVDRPARNHTSDASQADIKPHQYSLYTRLQETTIQF